MSGRDLELRTPRLLLRSFRATDVDDALAYRNDPEFATFLPHVPQPFTREHAEAFVHVNMTEPWETLPTFAVVTGDHVIGTVNLEIDPPSRTAMLGYALARAHWGKGLATEAATAVVQWGFAAHDLVEIWASTAREHRLAPRDGEARHAARYRDRRQDHVPAAPGLTDARVSGACPSRSRLAGSGACSCPGGRRVR